MQLAGAKLIGFDLYRDGGSVSMSYRTAQGIQCELTFKANLVPPEYKPNGYVEALLDQYIPTARTSPITGITDHSTKVESRSITWNEAKEVLEHFRPQVSGFTTDYQWVYPEMTRAAASNGQAA